MTKRLKYTKDILTHMLNNNNGAGGAAVTSKGGSSNPLGGSTTGSGPTNIAGTGSVAGFGTSSRVGTLSSAVSSKRSMAPGGMGDTGTMPSSVTGRTSSSNNLNLGASDRRPLNVLNQGQ